MEIASQHAERERVAAGQDMKERLFLHRIAGQSGHITKRDFEFAALMKPHLANAAAPLAQETPMAARHTSHFLSFAPPESAGDGMPVQSGGERFGSSTVFHGCLDYRKLGQTGRRFKR